MVVQASYDIMIIGSGPAGYVAGIRAAQLGLSSCVIERDKPGGVCLNEGCIPVKNLIHQAGVYSARSELERMGVSVSTVRPNYVRITEQAHDAARTLSDGVRHLLKKNNVPLIEGTAHLVSPNDVALDNGAVIRGKSILIATGSQPRAFPDCPFDGTTVLSSTEALALDDLPESIIILGGGYIGCEFAYIFNSFGVAVHLIEMEDQILPREDSETVAVLARSFRRKGIKVSLRTHSLTIEKGPAGTATVTVEGPDGILKDLTAEKVLVACGRTPNAENLGLEALGIATDNGYITTGDYYQSTVKGVYAAGDVISSPALAHVASKEGETAVEHIAGLHPQPRINVDEIPLAVCTDPQVAGFGMTEKEARAQDIPYRKGIFPFKGCGKAVATGKHDGLVKVLVDPGSGAILGAHAAGYNAAELIHEILLARTAGIAPETVALMIHAHPTMSEAVMEVMRALAGRAIHL